MRLCTTRRIGQVSSTARTPPRACLLGLLLAARRLLLSRCVCHAANLRAGGCRCSLSSWVRVRTKSTFSDTEARASIVLVRSSPGFATAYSRVRYPESHFSMI